MMHRNRRGDPHFEGTESEGGYLASTADLMIGLLFVFIILVVVLALEQRRQAIASKGLGDPRGMVTTQIGEELRLVLPNVRIDAASGVISLPEDVLFDIGKAELGTKGKEALFGAIGELTRALPCYVANQRMGIKCPHNPAGHEIDTIFVEGHTDNRPIARIGYDNTNLALDRARAVYAALVSGTALAGYRNVLNQPLFSFSAYADTRPLPQIDASDARNRRVDLKIVLTYRPLETYAPSLGIKLN